MTELAHIAVARVCVCTAASRDAGDGWWSDEGEMQHIVDGRIDTLTRNPTQDARSVKRRSTRGCATLCSDGTCLRSGVEALGRPKGAIVYVHLYPRRTHTHARKRITRLGGFAGSACIFSPSFRHRVDSPSFLRPAFPFRLHFPCFQVAGLPSRAHLLLFSLLGTVWSCCPRINKEHSRIAA